MFIFLHDTRHLFFLTRFGENCRWDVPAAAVIHPHNLLLRLRPLIFHDITFLCFTLSLWQHRLRFTHLFLYSLNVHCLTSLCSCSNISFFYFWFYNFIVLFMTIIFIFTHGTYSDLRYHLKLPHWHCCPLLFKVDKTCSYSNFIRTHSIYHTHLFLTQLLFFLTEQGSQFLAMVRPMFKTVTCHEKIKVMYK